MVWCRKIMSKVVVWEMLMLGMGFNGRVGGDVKKRGRCMCRNGVKYPKYFKVGNT